MKRLATAVAIAVLACAGTVAAVHPAEAGVATEEYAGVAQFETVITDREGDKLKAYILRPADAHGKPVDGKFPVIMHYTYFPAITWERTTAPVMQPLWTVLGFNLAERFDEFVRRGYVVAHVSMPGAGGSQGHFTWDKKRLGRSGYDAVEWLAKQPWSTGKVGMFGGSGNGIAQLWTAAEKPPHLTTIIPAVAFQDFYRDTMYRGGMPAAGEAALIAGLAAGIWAWQGNGIPDDVDEANYLLETMLKRVTELKTPPPFLLEWYSHPTKDSYWDNFVYEVKDITIPVWSWGNWDDHFVLGNVRLFQEVGSKHKMLTLGANGHSTQPGFDPIHQALRWYDYWLKGKRDNGIAEEMANAPVRYYVRGANEWRTATSWPPSDVDVKRLYADGGAPLKSATGRLSERPPQGNGGSDSYLYTPVSSRLGAQNGFLNQRVPLLMPRKPITDDTSTLLAFNNPTGQIDQRLNAADSVTYVGPVLDRDVEVTGEPKVTLRASSTATDTDWVVRLVDVYPDGSVVPQPGYWNLVETGWLKGTHRNGHRNPVPIPPGKTVTYEIDVWPTSYLFKKGHRIGLQIASADPRTLPNLTPALNTVHRSGASPTFVEVPVRPH